MQFEVVTIFPEMFSSVLGASLLGKAQARVAILLNSGERPSVFVEHAVGSVQNPMSDRMLEDKFRGLADGILAPGKTDRLIGLCWNAHKLDDAADIPRNAASA